MIDLITGPFLPIFGLLGLCGLVSLILASLDPAPSQSSYIFPWAIPYSVLGLIVFGVVELLWQLL